MFATAPLEPLALPAPEPFSTLLPRRGIAVGTATLVSGPIGSGVYMAIVELLAKASGAGRNIAIISIPDLGVGALADAGWDLERLASIDVPASEAPRAAMIAMDGFDIVLLPIQAVGQGWRRVAAKARERKAAVVVVDRGGDTSHRRSILAASGVDAIVSPAGVRWDGPLEETVFGSPVLEISVEHHGRVSRSASVG